MYAFSTYLDEKVLQKGDINLYVFDIDDTLFKSTAKILVKKDGKVLYKLSGAQYNKHKLKDGEEYDFGQFRSSAIFKNSIQPIDKVLKIARKLISRSGPRHKTIIITARRDMDDKEEFLQTFRNHNIDIDKVYIERAGNLALGSAAKNKKIVFNKYLSTGQYGSVTFFDDSKANINSFMSLKTKYPNVEFKAFHVDENGTTKEV